MATKRQAVAQIPTEDIKLVADAAEAGAKTLDPKDQRKVKRAVKALRTVKAAAK